MKKKIRLSIITLFLVIFNNIEYSLIAQIFDNPINIDVSFFVRGDPDTGPPTPEVETGFLDTEIHHQFNSGPGWANEATNQETLTIGEVYTFPIVAVINMNDYEIVFDVPTNFYIHINGSHRHVIGMNEITDNEFTVRVLRNPTNAPVELGFGVSSGLGTGKMLWELGLGALPNGLTAGVIELKGTSFDYTPGGLKYYDEYDEVEAIYDVSDDLRQVYAPLGLVDIITNNFNRVCI